MTTTRTWMESLASDWHQSLLWRRNANLPETLPWWEVYNTPMQGDSEKGKFYRSKLRMTNKIDYINIPVLAKIGIARNLALKVGLQPSFNIRHDFELNGSNTVYHNAGDLSKIGIDIKKFDLALPVGIAYEFNHHGSACLVAEARWNIGMLKIAEVESGGPYNMLWQLTLGYRFTFGNSIK